jgi:hypothetical protein
MATTISGADLVNSSAKAWIRPGSNSSQFLRAPIAPCSAAGDRRISYQTARSHTSAGGMCFSKTDSTSALRASLHAIQALSARESHRARRLVSAMPRNASRLSKMWLTSRSRPGAGLVDTEHHRPETRRTHRPTWVNPALCGSSNARKRLDTARSVPFRLAVPFSPRNPTHIECPGTPSIDEHRVAPEKQSNSGHWHRHRSATKLPP